MAVLAGVWRATVTRVDSGRVFVRVSRLGGDTTEYEAVDVGVAPTPGASVLVAPLEGRSDELAIVAKP